MSGILLDTCAIIWIANGDNLKNNAFEIIAEAQNIDECYISPISAWEIAHLVNKRKINLSMPTQDWFNSICKIDGIKLADLSPKILMSSVEIDSAIHQDPADRIIIATARAMNLTLISRDGLIKKYAKQGFLKFLEC
jgi:PIN domain nuclease of toxin-antitoxin system